MGLAFPLPPQILNKNFRWYIKIGPGRFVKNTAFPLRALFVTAFLLRCVLLAGLMFLPSSSRNMQRECQTSCCQMIMEIFFSSGERSLRIWVFSLEVKAGAGFRKRGCTWHQSCVIFGCQCASHLCNDHFPEGLWTQASLHFWTNVVLHKPEFYENLPLSATSFLGETDKTSCKPPALLIFCSVGHGSVLGLCQITGGVMSTWNTSKRLGLSDLVLRFILLASNLKPEHCIPPILL